MINLFWTKNVLFGKHIGLSRLIPFCSQLLLVLLSLSSCSDVDKFADKQHGSIIPEFENYTKEAKVESKYVSFSSCSGDLNSDGFYDLIVSYHKYTLVYMNNRDGTFQQLDTLNYGLDNHGVSIIDFENDYKNDFAVSIGSKKGKDKGTGNTYFSFNENSEWEQIESIDNTITDYWGRGRVIVPLDFNIDGVIDILLVNFAAKKSKNNSNHLFLGKSRDNSVLVDYTEHHSLIDSLKTTSISVVNLFNTKDRYLICDRGGRDAGKVFKITEVLDLIDVTRALNLRGGSIVWRVLPFDYDNDGDFDLLYLNRDKNNKIKNQFYENNGKKFLKRKVVGLSDLENSTDAVTGDFNNDGFTDVYILNLNKKGKKIPNELYLNIKGEKFIKLQTKDTSSEESEKKEPIYFGQSLIRGFNSGESNGVLTFDYDNDGDLDIFIHNGKGKLKGENILLRNITNANKNYVSVVLESKISNTQSWGARVSVECTFGTLLQQKVAANNKLGVSDLPLHFGIGDNKRVDVIVNWPSGIRTVLKGVKANQTVIIKEKIQKNANKKKNTKPQPLPSIEKLKKSDKQTRVIIQHINGNSVVKDKQPFRLTDKNIVIKGIAVDTPYKTVAAGVYVKIGKQYFKTKYRLPSKAFAENIKNPKYNKVGFIANIPKSKIKKGDYEVSICVVSRDRKTYYEHEDKVKIKVR